MWKEESELAIGYCMAFIVGPEDQHRKGTAAQQGIRDDKEVQALFIYFSFIFICWRLITLQFCSGICHTLT